MIFMYEELKDYVIDDYEIFVRRKFDDDEMICAILDEYQFGEGFCVVEKICIYLFLALIFKENNRNYKKIVELIQQELLSISETEIRQELKMEYELYEKDMNEITKCNM